MTMELLDVGPSLPLDNGVYERGGDSVTFGKRPDRDSVRALRWMSLSLLSLSVIYLSDTSHLTIREDRLRASGSAERFSLGWLLSAFPNRILHIFAASSQPKMLRIYARRIVAGMTNALTGRYRSFAHFIRHTMSQVFVPIVRNSTISIPLGCTRPQPTTVWSRGLVNAIPKSFFKRYPLKFATGTFVSTHVAQSNSKGDLCLWK